MHTIAFQSIALLATAVTFVFLGAIVVGLI